MQALLFSYCLPFPLIHLLYETTIKSFPGGAGHFAGGPE